MDPVVLKLSLEDLVERQAALATDGQIYKDVIQAFEKPLLVLLYKKLGNNEVKTAEILGINRNTLRKKLTFYGVKTCQKELSSSISMAASQIALPG